MSSFRIRFRSALNARSDGRLAAITPNPTRRLYGAATHPARAFRSPSTVHPFAAGVKRHLNVYLTLRVCRVKRVVSVAIASLLSVAALTACGGGFDVSVSSWKVGSPDVAGSIVNNTGAGCSDPEITLSLRDHNDAVVRTFKFGAGDLAAGASRKWSTHMVGLLFSEAPAESNVKSVTATAACADKH